MKIPDPHIIVIFGASGDLTKRMLIPAIHQLFIHHLLPDNFAILGTSRTPLTDLEFRKRMNEFLPVAEEANYQFLDKIYYQTIDYESQDDYQKLKTRLESLGQSLNIPPNYLFYLSTPPNLYDVIPEKLALADLNLQADGFKKPFLFSLGFGRIGGSVDALNPQAGAGDRELGGVVDLAVIHIQRFGQAALEDSQLQHPLQAGQGFIPKEFRMGDEPGVVIQDAQQNRIDPLTVGLEHAQRAVMKIQVPQSVDVFVFVAAHLPSFVTVLGGPGTRTVNWSPARALEQPLALHAAHQRGIARHGTGLRLLFDYHPQVVKVQLVTPTGMLPILKGQQFDELGI